MKILILSASPTRDAIVDELLSEELRKYGHEVYVRPCLREGRDAVLEHKPDVVVVPPIRNPYSRDFVEVMKGWGIGVVSRHTEPSCDKHDYEKMSPQKQQEILGQYPYFVDAELVWSQDEADILNTQSPRRSATFKTYPIGAVTVDAYMRPDVIAKYRNREKFNAKYGFDNNKKTLLICSPWGFADAAPDLHVEDLDDAKKDIEGRDRHFAMIRLLAENLRDTWNILISAHPGVVQKPYKDLCEELKLPFDTESRSFDLNIHVDGIVHAGSTMAINAHLLGIPAWQFGDVNAKKSDSWWGDPEAPISKISPYFKTPEELLAAIKNYSVFVSGCVYGTTVTGHGASEVIYTAAEPQGKPASNANPEALAALEKGRFGIMDGKSLVRAGEIINHIKGEFKLCWPKSRRDYSQLTIIQDPRRLYTPMKCGICKEEFAIVNESYLNAIKTHTGFKGEFAPPHGHSCPWCGARYFLHEEEPKE